MILQGSQPGVRPTECPAVNRNQRPISGQRDQVVALSRAGSVDLISENADIGPYAHLKREHREELERMDRLYEERLRRMRGLRERGPDAPGSSPRGTGVMSTPDYLVERSAE